MQVLTCNLSVHDPAPLTDHLHSIRPWPDRLEPGHSQHPSVAWTTKRPRWRWYNGRECLTHRIDSIYSYCKSVLALYQDCKCLLTISVESCIDDHNRLR